MTLTGGAGTQKTLDTLITSDINTGVDKALSNPWRGAEAWHFLILAHKMLYGGNYKQALQCAIRLQEYELELDPKRVYSVVATTAFFAGHMKECSTAIMRLEGRVFLM
jgi:WD repeat-containing protein 35